MKAQKANQRWFQFCCFPRQLLNGKLGEEQNLNGGCVYQYVHVLAYVCMYLCVCERETDRDRIQDLSFGYVKLEMSYRYLCSVLTKWLIIQP